MAPGTLFVVATPIGNLDDMTPRAVETLQAVDLIAAEDTRHSKPMLRRFGVERPLVSYHDFNEDRRAPGLLDALEAGKNVALICDAGTPCVSDPGYAVVRAAHGRGYRVVAVPGASALTAALSVSGMPCEPAVFHGFFPRRTSAFSALWKRMRAFGGTHVFFESPRRVAKTLGLLAQTAPGVEVCAARELSKVYENIVMGPVEEVLGRCGEHGPAEEEAGPLMPEKGEFVLLVNLGAPVKEAPSLDTAAIRARVEAVMAAEGLSRRDAVRHVAKTLDLPRNEVYAAAAGDGPSARPDGGR